ncbi:hypothetical protein JCGZ_23772 [Jatropha curcas]|uniref:Protein kinase domain-containing protein n=1 Tax=Jatropha curcas TaxID=180498 RepID=A0A067LE98_JATCU|nr:rust resistance kinase Lr10 [Jatropha curcas]KDP42830.1 hypothetical protein JCGZ_23772 [Jatropha curcas]
MSKESLLFLSLVSLFLLLQPCKSKSEKNDLCAPSSCGNLQNITYPFRLQTDPKNCGSHRYTLICQKNTTILYLYSGKYYVQAINYDNFTIRLVDSGVEKGDCASFPRFPLTIYNFSLEDPFATHKFSDYDASKSPPILTFISCPFQVSSPLYVETLSCTNYKEVAPSKHLYVNVGGMEAKDLKSNCSLEMMAMLPNKDYKNMSFIEIHKELAYGFELSWHYIYCGGCRGCYFDDPNKVQCISDYFTRVCYLNFGIGCKYLFNSSTAYVGFYRIIVSTPTVVVLLVLLHCVTKTLCGTPFVIGLLIYKWRRRHLSGYNTVEEFLQSHNNLMPVRYSYSDIKRMTEGFKNKLGQGGFGSVYKGKLRSGRIAAIKILNNSKTNGQDFISEVATLGRIHHANVVQLIGFCVDGSKNALVYDFMPNGSLNNYVFSQGRSSISLTWEKLHEISIGIARGIEYLHRGCDMQILHFDIKPHNILLDENFIPKISDFGLAKLYATNGSIKSLSAARGTIGYMAPELFYRNIGHVSYKADVYSFGMLLLEIAGKRKNLNVIDENSSGSYFPFWVYDEVSNEKDVGIGYATEEENKMAKKMVVVGLWCIQMNPSNRPSMNKVIQMLEGDLESLQLPPRSGMSADESPENYAEEESSSLPVDFSESSSLIENSF